MEFRLLGTFEVWVGEQRHDVGAARQRALLALLLLNANRPLSSEWLIEQMWNGLPPRAARATLQSCVYRLRKLLDQAVYDSEVDLRTHPTGYLLQVPAERLDLSRFEQLLVEGREAEEAGAIDVSAARLREGLRLWRGAAMEGIDVPAVRQHAVRLDQLRLGATEQCLGAELALGRHEEIVAELEALTAQHPLRERLWELLMTALYRCGRSAEALEAYQWLYRTLAEDLGVEPGRPLRQLHQQILMRDPVLDLADGRRSRPDRCDHWHGRGWQDDSRDSLGTPGCRPLS